MSSESLDPIEVASGLVFGSDRHAEPIEPQPQTTPRAVLEAIVLSALEHPPCLVSFSGGRDSSAVLALATHVARREGLPLPIPATNRFVGVETTDESDWQQLVVRRLELDDWHRLELTDELDSVGPVSTKILLRHGLLWPFNAFFHYPILEAAAGGSLLTGIGGDEQLGESRYARANDVLTRRVRPRPRDLLRVGFSLAPGSIRAAALRRRAPVRYPWLRPEGHRELIARWSAQAGREPRRYDRRVLWWPRLRSVRIGFASLERLARDAGTRIVHPLADPRFAAALTADGGNPPADRTARMRAIFGDLLPAELLSRPTKAQFDAAFWRRHSREFAARWSGGGIPVELVDEEALREEWRSSVPLPQSFTLLQSAWLAEHRGRH